jgi:hypothetical protein
MSFVENLSYFFKITDFGSSATYLDEEINGIFGSAYLLSNDVESSFPAFTCKTTDVPTVEHGDTLIINEVTYKVINVRPDGTGVVILVLQEQD